MNRHQRMVLDFHRAMGSTVGHRPEVRDAQLRVDLIREEYLEFADAVGLGMYRPEPPSLIEAIDAIADLLYVIYGAAVAFGIDIEPFFEEVHRSNMTKAGGPIREDGKVLKPAHYSPPNLEPILRQQINGSVRRILDEIDQDRFDQAAALAPLATAEELDDYMCPNCVTPWKCNGPHEIEVSEIGAKIRWGSDCE